MPACFNGGIHSNYTTVPSPTDRTTPLNEQSVSGPVDVWFGVRVYIATTYTVLGGLRVGWRPLRNKLCFANSIIERLCKIFLEFLGALPTKYFFHRAEFVEL